MKKFGLIGYPLSHSFSKNFFSEKFEREGVAGHLYDNYPIDDLEKFPELLNDQDLIGLNVTIPYKEGIIDYLDEQDDVSREIGAVNTIKIKRSSGKLVVKGFNTDAYGFYQAIKPYLKKHHQSAIILGTGGSSKAVAYVFKQLGIDVMFVSRQPKVKEYLSYLDLCGPVLYNFQIIVNTTPVGMYPNTDQAPDIPYEFVTKNHLLFDLVYNPEKTRFLQQGEAKKAVVVNGLEMLHQQALRAWEIWNSDNF